MITTPLFSVAFTGKAFGGVLRLRALGIEKYPMPLLAALCESRKYSQTCLLSFHPLRFLVFDKSSSHSSGLAAALNIIASFPYRASGMHGLCCSLISWKCQVNSRQEFRVIRKLYVYLLVLC